MERGDVDMAKARSICTHKKCCKQGSSISGERQQLESSVAIVRRDPEPIGAELVTEAAAHWTSVCHVGRKRDVTSRGEGIRPPVPSCVKGVRTISGGCV